MFEPVHGSAPELAGKNCANPIAMIWTVKMMLDQLMPEMSHEVIIDGITEMLQEGIILTPDLGGNATTQQVGDALCEKVKAKIQ
jgi:tartrate dehydrogenase/decarboxylase/D-malate dehydrogenase